MVKLLFLGFLLFAQLANATFYSSFEEAQKVALATNKFILTDFTRSWCAPTTKPKGLCTLNLDDQYKVLQQYVTVQVDHQTVHYYF